jgi:uncharacterized protein
MATATISKRSKVRRQPKRGRYDREAIDAALDAGLVAHLAFVDEGQPYCIPTLYARVGDEIYVHGSAASRMLRTLGAGVPACLTVTAVHGLVLARSVFEHSANYESVVVLGTLRLLTDDGERLAALQAFTDKLVPGRWDEVRPPSRQELKGTAILAMSIEEASLKARSGPPSDDDSEDAERDVWAGELPIESAFGTPVASPGLRGGVPLSASVRRLLARE